MSVIQKVKDKPVSTVSGVLAPLFSVFKSSYFYIGLLAVIAGIELNFISQTYLQNQFVNAGRILPELSDMILDRLPLYDVSLIYDLFSTIPVIILIVYIFQKREFNRIPYFLLLMGILEIIRGIFIVITPLGNPPMFTGSNTLFNGFSKYELGVYPSGHVGSAFLLFLMVRDRTYKFMIFICVVAVILSLFLAHAHYSIDILSGIFFAYALESFGSKYLKMFELGESNGFSIPFRDRE